MNNSNPNEIGEYISALSNSAVLKNESFGYLIWGVQNKTHEIVGTSFSPKAEKVGNEELENWLLRLLSPKIAINFYEFEVDGKRISLIRVGRAFSHPVRFKRQSFVRVGSYKKKLIEFPQMERALWRAFERESFEDTIAEDQVGGDQVLELLDYASYFELLERSSPSNPTGILKALQNDNLIQPEPSGHWRITGLGAILFARRLEDFRTLRRKAVRMIFYEGHNKLKTDHEHVETKGFAAGFTDTIDYITSRLPSNEVIERALRRNVPMYPILAVRELVANALIHQDFAVSGAGPMIEVFADRMEISNPGVPLIPAERFLDASPRSRNEALASLMRRMGICEERGSGIDKVVAETEIYQLPAPIFEMMEGSTRAILFAPRPVSEMTREDRIRACYFHACLQYVKREDMTNSTLRARFGIEARNSATVSRYIREAVDAEMIQPYDENAGPKYMKYVPFWA